MPAPPAVDRARIGSLLDRFTVEIKRRDFRMTRQRMVIARRFFAAGGHVSVDDLYERLLQDNPDIGYATVYRTLRLLVECGIARTHHFGANKVRFELQEGDDHHDHLICTVCGRIIEFEDDRIEGLQVEVARRHDFTMMSHRMEIYGICGSCMA